MEKDLRILVLGIGNGGIQSIEKLAGNYCPNNVEYWALNTDKQLLENSKVPNKLLLGENIAQGLGCGGNPALGRKCAIESKEAIQKILFGADMVYLVSCLSGGTGTGAVSIISEIAKRMGILTISVVTFPFSFEGNYKLRQAIEGMKELKKYTNAYIKIRNQDMVKVVDKKCTMDDAFSLVDKVIHNTITSICDILLSKNTDTPSTNIDFADIRRIFNKAGELSVVKADAEGENKTDKVIEKLLKNSSIDTSLSRAKSLILNVTGDENITLHNVHEIAQALDKKISANTEIIFGCIIDEKLKDEIKVTLLWNSI